jgi:basic membrane protein A
VVYPNVFVGSAIADVSIAALRAAHDVANGEFQSGTVVEIGLEKPDAVRLSLAPSVPETVRKRTDALSREIVGGDIEVETTYDGPEFEPAGASR